MKKLYIAVLSALVLGISPKMMSQNTPEIPNNSFENWTTEGFMIFQYENPTGWQSLSVDIDTFGFQFSYPISSISKTTDAQSGTYAAMLETKQFDELISSALSSMGNIEFTGLPSIMSIGKINVLSMITDLAGMMNDDMGMESLLQTLLAGDISNYLQGGMPLNGFTPGGLKGYYKYIPGENGTDDAAMILLVGTRYDSGSNRRSVTGLGMSVLEATNNEYQEFEIPYFTLPLGTADSLEIIIFSSQIQNMTIGSKLYIDNLSLSGANSINSADDSQINCYPNPTSGNITLSINDNSSADVIFYNNVGQKVLEQKDCGNGTMFTLPQSGTYLMVITQNGHKTVKTIVVK